MASLRVVRAASMFVEQIPSPWTRELDSQAKVLSVWEHYHQISVLVAGGSHYCMKRVSVILVTVAEVVVLTSLSWAGRLALLL